MRYIIIIMLLLLTACGSTLNVAEPEKPYYTTTEIVYDGVTWHGEYYNDRWHWSVVE